MKVRHLIIILIFLTGSFSSSAQSPYNGIWTGQITTRGMTIDMDIVIDMDQNEALLSVPIQGLDDVKSTKCSIREDSIYIGFSMFNATYAGVINDDAEKIDGHWSQGTFFELNLHKTKSKTQFSRPQTPEEPYPYDISEVEIANIKEDVKLSGTLTTPKGLKEYPIVILVSGSGKQDRNSEILKHKPFLVIADHFARKGIATLRYDDRGAGQSTGVFSKATSMNLASDAEAVFSYAKGLDGVTKAGIVGHSEGGLIAPLIASRNKSVDFIISMAGPAVPIVELMTKQNVDVLKTSGMSVEGLAITQKQLPIIYAVINQDKEPKDLFDSLISVVHSYYDSLPVEDQKLLGRDKTTYYLQLSTVVFTPWFRYFLAYDPSPSWSEVKCPVLAINGSKDIQVSANENISSIEKITTKSGNRNVETQIFEGLNHLFQSCTTCDVSEYAKIETTIENKVLDRMVGFILKLD